MAAALNRRPLVAAVAMPNDLQSGTEREPRILVVDDSPTFCELMRRILHRAGFRQVVETHRVSDALAALNGDAGDGTLRCVIDGPVREGGDR